MRQVAVLTLIAIFTACASLAAENLPKIAVHLEKYSETTCELKTKELVSSPIVTTLKEVGKINAYVVLFDYEEFKGITFSLRWPELWGNAEWHDCGDLRIGNITEPGDETSIVFRDCITGGKPFVIGFLTVTVISPGKIEIEPSHSHGVVAIANCNEIAPKMSEVPIVLNAGVAGAEGTDTDILKRLKNRCWKILPDSSGDAQTINQAVRCALPGDTILVAGGVYNETIYLRRGVAILGSWDSDFKRQDLERTPSIIKAPENSTCIVGSFGEDSTTVLDGFVLTSGNGHYGGGIALRNGSSPVLRNLIIHTNTARQGGGIFCHASSPLIQNVLIAMNSADLGGGICCTIGSSPRIVNTTIVENEAQKGSGIMAMRNSSPHLEKSIVAYQPSGWGIYCEGATSRVVFTCCDLWSNVPSDFGGTANKEMGLRDNLSIEPTFVNREQLDFTLQENSPLLKNDKCGTIGSKWGKIPSQ